MTEERLREIEAREAAATPGPWRRGVGNTAMRVCSAYPAKSYFICEGTNADDLEFAANSREDIPELVAEVRRLREGLEFYAEKANWRTTSKGFAAQYDRQSPPAIVDGGIRARLALMSQLDGSKP